MNRDEMKKATRWVAKRLWEDWDPFGINDGVPYGSEDEFACTDEYDSFAPAIAKLLLDGADDTALAEHLAEVTKYLFGHSTRPEADIGFAQDLIRKFENRTIANG